MREEEEILEATEEESNFADETTGESQDSEVFAEALEDSDELEQETHEQKELDLSSVPEFEESGADDLDFSAMEEDEEDLVCEFEMDLRKKVLEGVLFISDKPVGLSTFIAAFGVEESGKDKIIKKHILEALEALEDDLIQNDRGFRLHQVDGGYQLRTDASIKDFLHNTVKARSFRLTGPSLETLSMVAYRQPITKSQIDDIRGVDSSHLLRALMDRNLVAFAGKSELPGKPMLYKTTAKFLEVFGLRNLKELPSLSEIEALLPNGIGEEEEEKESLSDLTGKLSEDYDGSYSVGEEELGKITNELSDISTSSDFFEQEKLREKERREMEKAENIREALMVGEEVSERDQRWLVRFDEKQAAAANPDASETAEAHDEVLEGEDASDVEVSTDMALSSLDFEEDQEVEEEALEHLAASAESLPVEEDEVTREENLESLVDDEAEVEPLLDNI